MTELARTVLASPWPDNYGRLLTLTEEKEKLETIRNSVNRGKPYGDISWTKKVLKKFGLEITENKRGRPKKGS